MRSSNSTHDGRPRARSRATKRAAAPPRAAARGSAAARDAWLRELLAALRAAERGDFSVRLAPAPPARGARPADRAIAREIAAAYNGMAGQVGAFAAEVARVAREVGTEGRLGAQADAARTAGVFRELTETMNALSSGLAAQLRDIAAVTTAVARGDLSRKITAEMRGEPGALKATINLMVEQLARFVAEVARVAHEVGTQGRLGSRAEVEGVAGVWAELTRNVNSMAANLTTQVRGIARVVTAVANGDLTQRFEVDAAGEVAALARTINNMTDTLSVFAEQVIDVAREVGIEGRLGGQAAVPGARGTWRRLTDNVNELAESLTTQIRAISEVATAVAQGDLSRAITVQAQGEVAALKDNVNRMIVALSETTAKNREQDWLKTHLARFSTLLQGHESLASVARLIMRELTPLVGAHQGAFYVMEPGADDAGAPALVLTAAYAHAPPPGAAAVRFGLGEGLVGQCAADKRAIELARVPGEYVHARTGLGGAPPLHLLVLPVLFEGEVKAVIELASFAPPGAIHRTLLEQLTGSIGVVLHTIRANMRTEALLLQSQALTEELQSQSRELTVQQDELRRTNAALAQQAIELADKAAQLAQSAHYKSEFLANMSHELRTPLNSLLILARLLAGNAQKNLTDKQVEYARTIVSAGGDLLALINEVLDLAKVESGKLRVEPREVLLDEVRELVERGFAHVAEQKGLRFEIALDAAAPRSIRTDPQRLMQIVTNLLANAFKFTELGGVRLAVGVIAAPREAPDGPAAARGAVVTFAVSDTGIGIASDKHEQIFEAFQQADGTTSRRYGGTGLGLSISRELARLLGGELRVASAPGQGSTFTLYLPERGAPELDPPREPPAGAPAPDAPDALPHPGAGQPPQHERAAADTLHAPPSPARAARGTDPAARGLRLVEPDAPRAARATEAPAPRARAAGPVPGEADGALAGRKVLIVDDDMRNIFALASLLESEQAEVLFAEDGRAGIAQLAEHPDVDAVLMDIMMPEMDGYETMRAIRSDPRYAAVPIIAITAKALADDRDRCVRAGATEYLPKPVDTRRLVELIRTASRS